MRDVTEIAAGEVLRRLRERGVTAEWRGEPPAVLAGLSADSRDVERGDLFVAVPGTSFDGHEFVDEAAESGARAAVVERPVKRGGLPQLVVSDSRVAVSHLAALFRGDPAADMRLVGVTGTNGKTTTTWLTRHVLSGALSTGAVGTLGVTEPDGRVRSGELTTPGPVRLHRQLRELRDGGAEAAVLEISSHALDQRRAAALDLEAAIFTTLSREHLEYHRDMKDYRRAKLRLAERVRRSGACLVNADEPAWEDADFAGRRIVRYGLDEAADVRAVDVEATSRATRFGLAVRGEVRTHPVELRMPGDYNVRNALASAAAGLEFGLDPDRTAELLTSAPQAPGRLERLRDEAPVVIRDYAHTPEAMERAIRAVRRLTPDRLLVVFGAGGERDRGKRPLMGEVADRLADDAWITNDNPRSEDPAEIARDVAEGMTGGEPRIELDRREAIRRAMQAAGPGDVVLLLGKGHETEMVIEGESIPFDEAQVVAELSRDLEQADGKRDLDGADNAAANAGGTR